MVQLIKVKNEKINIFVPLLNVIEILFAYFHGVNLNESSLLV